MEPSLPWSSGQACCWVHQRVMEAHCAHENTALSSRNFCWWNPRESEETEHSKKSLQGLFLTEKPRASNRLCLSDWAPHYKSMEGLMWKVFMAMYLAMCFRYIKTINHWRKQWVSRISLTCEISACKKAVKRSKTIHRLGIRFPFKIHNWQCRETLSAEA